LIQKTLQIYTDKEEEFIGILTSIGTQKNVAKMLMYLAKLERATSRDIERGVDLRQSEVCVALKYLEERGWIECRKIPSERRGRRIKLWSLKLPFEKILDIIGNEKQQELSLRMDRVRKVRDFA